MGGLLASLTFLCYLRDSYEAGIQTFDTANVYSNGGSEIILGEAIKQLNLPRDEIVVMTKVRIPSYSPVHLADTPNSARYMASLAILLPKYTSGVVKPIQLAM